MADKQDELRKFIEDPENIKKAVEGSMDKRLKKLASKPQNIDQKPSDDIDRLRQELIDIIYGDWITYEALEAGRVGGVNDGEKPETTNQIDSLIAIINTQTTRARIEMAEMYTAMGRDNFDWGAYGVPEEVLKVFPDYRDSTADIPRGKEQFMDFVLERLQSLRGKS